jgi:hypothetical protein
MLEYTYTIDAVDNQAGVMEVTYTAGDKSMLVAMPIPYADQNLEAHIATFAPTRYWKDQERVPASVEVGTSGKGVDAFDASQDAMIEHLHIEALRENVLRDLPTVSRAVAMRACEFDLPNCRMEPVYHNTTRCVGVQVFSPEEAVGQGVGTLRDLQRGCEHVLSLGIPAIGYDSSPNQIHSKFAVKHLGATMIPVSDNHSITYKNPTTT